MRTDAPALMEQARVLAGPGPRIGYRWAGRGPVLLFLHGIGSGAGVWCRQAPLAGAFQCLAWDAPGYGDSQALAMSHPLAADYADALASFVERLALPPVVLVGHSLGAMMAAAFAARHPQHVRGLLLADPAQGYATATVQQRECIAHARHALLLELGSEEYARQRAALLLHPQADAQAQAIVRGQMRRLRADGFGQACRMLARDDIWNYLPCWRGPLRVLCGQQDNITPIAGAQRLAQRMGSVCIGLADAGHASYIDAASAFNAELAAFAQPLHAADTLLEQG